MRLSDITGMAIDSLGERKFRFILNLVGILIGCAAVTGLISITEGLSVNISGEMEVFGPENIMVIPGMIEEGRGMVTTSMTWKDLEILEDIYKMKKVTPIVANKYVEFNIKGRTFYVEMFGVTEDYFTINKNTGVEDGRVLIRTDINAVLVGANIAHPIDLDEPVIEVEDRIKISSKVNGEIKELSLRVIGVYERTGGSFGANLDDSIGIPFRTAQQYFEMGNTFDYAMAQAEDISEVDALVERIEDKMGDSVTVMSFDSAQELVGNVMGTIQAVLGGIAAISLVVAGVGIINTMTVSVMERTREIGVLKAIGAKSSDVLFMFISEAIVTGIIGGTLGALFGIALSYFVGNIINLEPSPSVELGLLVVGFAVATSVISGIYPAWRASNLNPVEALRSE